MSEFKDKFDKFAKNQRIGQTLIKVIAVEQNIKEEAAYSGFIFVNKKDIAILKEALTKLQEETLNAEL